MKIKFSWYESEKSNHASEWDVPWCDGWELREYIDERLELLRLRREVYELRKNGVNGEKS